MAVGDMHGDLEAARRALRIARVLDAEDRWIGGDSVVVQTGDLLDRGKAERPLLEWMDRLAGIAQQGGGALYRINGNHEVMNVAGDLRYIDESGFSSFAEYAREPLPGLVREAEKTQRGRLMAFLPGGPWARRLAQHPVVLLVNDTVFAHGGITLRHVDYGLERINSEVSAWMRGSAPLARALAGDNAPFWDRTYGESTSDGDCRMLDVVLARLSAKRLVIGHTPQKDGVTFACDKRVARIDVGLSRYYGNHAASVLEITGNTVNVLTEKSAHSRTVQPRATNRAEASP